LVRYESFHYQADSWTTARRVVANLPITNRAVVRFYNKRSTVEQWMKEGKQAARWTQLSCHASRQRIPVATERARVQPRDLSWRLVLPKRVDSWPLISLQQRLVETGGRLVTHARYYWRLAESHLTRRLFGRCFGGSGGCRCRLPDG
jgi:hypothetical protein